MKQLLTFLCALLFALAGMSVGNLSNLRDELKLLIVKCIKIEVNVETVMQIVDKAFKMGILDNDSLNDMKEIVAGILKAKDK